MVWVITLTGKVTKYILSKQLNVAAYENKNGDNPIRMGFLNSMMYLNNQSL